MSSGMPKTLPTPSFDRPRPVGQRPSRQAVHYSGLKESRSQARQPSGLGNESTGSQSGRVAVYMYNHRAFPRNFVSVDVISFWTCSISGSKRLRSFSLSRSSSASTHRICPTAYSAGAIGLLDFASFQSCRTARNSMRWFAKPFYMVLCGNWVCGQIAKDLQLQARTDLPYPCEPCTSTFFGV